jgi:hypothetical protein
MSKSTNDKAKNKARKQPATEAAKAPDELSAEELDQAAGGILIGMNQALLGAGQIKQAQVPTVGGPVLPGSGGLPL